jgi:hypothetical protein
MTAKTEKDRIVEAYLRMAAEAQYRPAAPSDGCGWVELTARELNDPAQLRREAEQYAARFREEEDTCQFFIGCSDWTTSRAQVYGTEALRVMCGALDRRRAAALFAMAIQELMAVQELATDSTGRGAGTRSLTGDCRELVSGRLRP